MDELLEKLQKEYIKKFKDGFPNINMSNKREIEIIKNCLEKEKDAYELGYFDLHSNKKY